MKNSKKLTALLAAAVMAVSSFSAVSAQSYSDVPTTHWAYENIERCKDKHWFSGYPDGTFRPDGEITRAEALKVIVTFMGLPLNEVTKPTYYDVAATAWYAPYVEAGKTLFPNRTALDGQKKFQPDMPVTREDVIYAMVTSLGYDSMTQFADLSVLNMFSDQNSISPDVKPYAAVAVSNSIVSGHADGTIGAQDPLTRAQFATLLYRASFIAPITSHTQKVVSSVTVDPSTMKEIKIGENFEIKATAHYTDGTDEDISTVSNPYTNSAEGIVTINKNKITAVGEGTAIINFNNDNMKDVNLVVVVSKPTDAPVITLDSYAAETEDETIEVTGKVTDATGTAITVVANGQSVAVNADGTFKTSFGLVVGKNDFTISAKNVYGNETTQAVSVERKAAPTPAPTVAPTVAPTPAPTAEPTVAPTAEPAE